MMVVVTNYHRFECKKLNDVKKNIKYLIQDPYQTINIKLE